MSRVLNTVVELIRLEDKLELLHMNFISLYIYIYIYIYLFFLGGGGVMSDVMSASARP